MKYEKAKNLKEEEFKRAIGVSKKMFDEMVKIIKENLRTFGRPAVLTREDQLLMTLMYLREYRTGFHIGLTYGVSESTVCRTIKKIENVLMYSGEFYLPGKKTLQSNDDLTVIIDAEEQPIERPKQKIHYSGKKKCHTQKAQLVINKETQMIVCTDFSNGKKHDFKLFKDSKTICSSKVLILGDSGYQGLANLHSNSQIPIKKTRSLAKVLYEANISSLL